MAAATWPLGAGWCCTAFATLHIRTGHFHAAALVPTCSPTRHALLPTAGSWSAVGGTRRSWPPRSVRRRRRRVTRPLAARCSSRRRTARPSTTATPTVRGSWEAGRVGTCWGWPHSKSCFHGACLNGLPLRQAPLLFALAMTGRVATTSSVMPAHLTGVMHLCRGTHWRTPVQHQGGVGR